MPRKPTLDTARRERMFWLGQRIRRAREAVGLTQAELSTKAGFAGGTWMSEVEAGRNSIDAHDLYRIASILGYAPGYFLDPNYDAALARTPQTRQDWELLFPGQDARAHAHADLDRIFANVSVKVLERPEGLASLHESGESRHSNLGGSLRDMITTGKLY